MTGKMRDRRRGHKRLTPPCPNCRRDRWKTLAKGSAWQCRWCRAIREVRPEHERDAAGAVAS